MANRLSGSINQPVSYSISAGSLANKAASPLAISALYSMAYQAAAARKALGAAAWRSSAAVSPAAAAWPRPRRLFFGY